MADLRTLGATSNRVRFTLKDKTTGQGKTGLSISTTGLVISTIADNEASATAYTQAGSTIETIATLGTFATPTSTKCRFKAVDATNHPGLYEFQFANARFAVPSAKRLVISVNDAESTILDADYEIEFTADLVSAVWDEINTGTTHNVTNSTGKQLRSLASSTDAIYPLSGTVNLTAATSTTATLDLLASNGAQAYQWNVLNILSGTGAGQSRIITNYTTGRVATVHKAWDTTPDATSTFDITPTASVQVVSYIAGQDPATLVLDVAQSGHNGAGTIGHDIGLIASGVTVTGTVDANVISVNGTTFAGANVPSILADGVAHGGTTALLVLQSETISNPAGVAVSWTGGGSNAGWVVHGGDSGGANAVEFAAEADGGWGFMVQGFNAAGIEVKSFGTGNAIEFNPGSGGRGVYIARGVLIEGGFGDTDVNMIDLNPVNGHGISIHAAGTGKKALLLAGDAATDALAIAAGSGTPEDVFNADGSVNVGNIEASALAELFTTNSTKVFSDAVNGSVVKEIATHASGGTSGPTASQIATAVWQDSTSGDFTVSGSIGKSLFTGGVVPGAAGGLFIAGTNAATTVTTSFTTTFTGNLTGNVGGNVTGTIGGLTAAALAMFFTVDTTKVFADAIGGSVVKEVSTGSGSDPWAVPVPGSYLAGTAGYILGNRLDASVSSRSTYSGTDTPGTLTLLTRIGGTITINGGAVAIDWAHVLNPTTAVALTGTTISPAQVVASVSGNVVGTIGGFTTAALAQFFTVNTGETYSGAVDGSIVHEIASNASGGGTSTLTAADVWTYGTRTLTSLGATAPAGWINAGSIVDHALDGKGDWSTYAGSDTPGTLTLLSRIGGTITINGGGVNVNLAQTLGSARALDSTGDTSLTLNDAMHCAVAVAAGQRVEDKIALTYVQKTPFTGTVLRTFSIDSASAPTRRT